MGPTCTVLIRVSETLGGAWWERGLCSGPCRAPHPLPQPPCPVRRVCTPLHGHDGNLLSWTCTSPAPSPQHLRPPFCCASASDCSDGSAPCHHGVEVPVSLSSVSPGSLVLLQMTGRTCIHTTLPVSIHRPRTLGLFRILAVRSRAALSLGLQTPPGNAGVRFLWVCARK